MSLDETIVRSQLELSERLSVASGLASYRKADGNLDDAVVGHAYGYDCIAFPLVGPAEDWTENTCVLDVAREPIEGLGEPWSTGAYLIRYPSEHRDRLSSFVLELLEKADKGDVVRSTDSIIRAWSHLWRRIAGPLDRHKQMGLYGELWVLERLIAKGGASRVQGWEGPAGERHDFAYPHRHLEVKTTGYSNPVLEVSSIDQLRPGHPELHLVMVQVSEGAGTTLPELVDRLRGRLSADPDHLRAFEDRLSTVRFLDQHATHYRTSYRNTAASVLAIDDDVPVLHRGRLDRPVPGLIEARWTLDPRALPFRLVGADYWELG